MAQLLLFLVLLMLGVSSCALHVSMKNLAGRACTYRIAMRSNKEDEGTNGVASMNVLSRRGFILLGSAMTIPVTNAHAASAAQSKIELELTKRNVEATERSSAAYEMANKIAELLVERGTSKRNAILKWVTKEACIENFKL